MAAVAIVAIVPVPRASVAIVPVARVRHRMAALVARFRRLRPAGAVRAGGAVLAGGSAAAAAPFPGNAAARGEYAGRAADDQHEHYDDACDS